ncbi:MAG: 23S rRNA (guanosine(2251)-2'-O)-methyltransferase RlmB [Anaerofustis sp.]
MPAYQKKNTKRQTGGKNIPAERKKITPVAKPKQVRSEPKKEEPEFNSAYDKVIGRNPVKEALRSGRNINKLLVAQGETDHTIITIINMAKERNVFVQMTDRRKLDMMTESGRHQGVVALCSPIVFSEVDELLQTAADAGEKPFLVMLDEITDPHNAGAIIRSAYCAGAHGVILSKRRSASISEGVYKASAGSVEYIKIAQVANLAQTIESLKKQGIFAVCCDMEGDAYYDLDYDMPLLVVVGSEGEGIGRLIKSKCDFSAKIPMKGKLDSLNASVAAGIVLFEAAKQRG